MVVCLWLLTEYASVTREEMFPSEVRSCAPNVLHARYIHIGLHELSRHEVRNGPTNDCLSQLPAKIEAWEASSPSTAQHLELLRNKDTLLRAEPYTDKMSGGWNTSESRFCALLRSADANIVARSRVRRGMSARFFAPPFGTMEYAC